MTRINKPKSLYIHVPFCEHLCDYCDFTKLQYFRNFAIKYLITLKDELESYQIEELDTIYVGGGTPTSLDDDLFLQLINLVKPYTKGVKEYTFEANPESLSINKLKMMKDGGVNRLSIGVESTDDEILKMINRHHNFNDVKIAVSNARKMGFDNLNLDLIIGLPNVSKTLFKKDLRNILSLNPDHISCYSLTVNPNTVFFINKIEEPNEEFARDLYELADCLLKENDFTHYEISNWAKKGKESLHNLTYWKDETYYGIGLGAAGYIDNIRYKNTKNLNKYLNKDYIEEKEVVSDKEDKTYFIMLNLRTNQGISLAKYKEKFSEDLYEKKKSQIDSFIKRKLLVLDDDKLYPTFEGMMILDSLVLDLID
ncbi:MAG: radical SAM family heme chaperone HemW [Bacilli bacterium]|nr:radical SAM family heme chaperone HemW [Bacilli bacterium]